MREELWFLGANGFIGKAIQPYLQKFKVTSINHKEIDWYKLKEKPFPDVIVNCSSSRPDSGFDESFEANCTYPTRLFDFISQSKTEITKWVQIGSYYELQIGFGRSDHYSLHKSLFSKILESKLEGGEIKLSSIILPHVTGWGERPDQITSICKSTFLSNGTLEMSKGDQYFPVLGIHDACTAISAAIETNQISCAASPVWHGRLYEYVHLIREAIGSGEALREQGKLSVDNYFPKVTFPETVNNWAAEVSIERIVAL